MTILETPPQPKKKPRRQSEMALQSACIRWAWNERPQTRNLLFHVQNEIDRPDANAAIGAIRRAEGIVRGVSDLILMMKRGPYGALCIEMKTETGCQSKFQKNWQILIEKEGYSYKVARSLQQFQKIIDEYLNL